MNKCHRSFNLSPFRVVDSRGHDVDMTDLMNRLKNDIRLVSDIAEWNINDDLREFVEKSQLSNNNTIGRAYGIDIPGHVIDGWKSGRSRFTALIADRAVREVKSWNERIKAYHGVSDKYVSRGWKRTVFPTQPRNIKPKISLSAVDRQYARLSVNNDVLELKLVISGQWYTLLFPFNSERFGDNFKITLPDVHIQNDRVIFSFTAQYEYTYSDLSDRYVVAVDVGLTNYVTVSVVDLTDNSIVETSTLSRRVHSLHNKVNNANQQIKSLRTQFRMNEARQHRESNSRRKRELAILAAQEIADIAYRYHAIIIAEDLSWIANTMQNGRWNRGELLHWMKHFVELNGSRVLTVSAYNTSQICHCHREKLIFLDWHTVVCHVTGEVMDRDVNATVNIAINGRSSAIKSVATRRKSKKLIHHYIQRSRNGSGKNLKYPGRDRTKSFPTSPKVKRKKVKRESFKVKSSASYIEDKRTVTSDSPKTCSAMTITGNSIIHNNKTLMFYKE